MDSNRINDPNSAGNVKAADVKDNGEAVDNKEVVGDKEMTDNKDVVDNEELIDSREIAVGNEEVVLATEEDDDSSASSVTNFIQELCSQYENEWLCPIPYEYFEHRMNLRGLREKVPCYDQALALLLDEKLEGTYSDNQLARFKNIAFELYKLVHQRYILTEEGMLSVYVRYKLEKYGSCPRTLCDGQPVLPVGLTHVIGLKTVKIFCGKCSNVYTPGPTPCESLDGSVFGPNLPMLFYFNYPELRPALSSKVYEPKLFGFKIHESCYTREPTETVREVRKATDSTNNSNADAQPKKEDSKKFGWHVDTKQ